MKTFLNINRNHKVIFTAATALLFATAGTLNASLPEEVSAMDRLEKMTLHIEASLKYEAPSTADTTTLFGFDRTEYNADVDAALERLDNLANVIEESVRYKAPEIAEDIEAYEVQAALERLENFSLATEESLKYKVENVSVEFESNDAAMKIESFEKADLAVK